MTDAIISGIKEHFRAIEKALDTEPIIFLDNDGGHSLNDVARDFIAKQKIDLEDLMDWLRIGFSHLQNLSYGNIGVKMMDLYGGGVVAFLKHGDTAAGKIEFTPKEKEVFSYLIKGFSNKKIAGVMKISAGTVNTHLDNIYQKLGCSNRHSACFIALKKGLFVPARVLSDYAAKE